MLNDRSPPVDAQAQSGSTAPMTQAPTNTPPPPAPQRTLAGDAELRGRGLFSGQPAVVRLRPAPEHHGLAIHRLDAAPDGEPTIIPVLVDHVAMRDRRTTLRAGDIAVETCEHCLSALAGLGIDNAVIEVEGPEMPAGDGSAAPFVEAIKAAGVAEQRAPRRAFAIREPITIEEDGATITALPAAAPGLRVLYELDYGEGPIGRQLHAYHTADGCYASQVAPARTFLLEPEAVAFRERGLGEHLTPQDLLVIGEEGPIGGNAYRFDNELARHKLLDVLGDLTLVGVALQGRIIAHRSGHALHHRLARKLRAAMLADQRRRLLVEGAAVDVRRIAQILPHRFPMLLVDRVLSVEGDRRAIGVKNVTVNEPFFQGHYPGSPIMPGVLIVEAMAQLSGLLLSRKLEHTGKIAVLLSMDGVKLRKPVTPGDQLVLEAEAVRVRSRTGHTLCKAYVGDHVAAEAEIKFMLVDAEQE